MPILLGMLRRHQPARNQQQGHQGGHEHGKGSGKGFGKHKGKNAPMQPAAPLPPPAGPLPTASWDSTSAPWMAVPPPPPVAEAAPSGEASAEQTLKLIAQQIQQNPDSATPEVHAIVQRHKTQGQEAIHKRIAFSCQRPWTSTPSLGRGKSVPEVT